MPKTDLAGDRAVAERRLSNALDQAAITCRRAQICLAGVHLGAPLVPALREAEESAHDAASLPAERDIEGTLGDLLGCWRLALGQHASGMFLLSRYARRRSARARAQQRQLSEELTDVETIAQRLLDHVQVLIASHSYERTLREIAVQTYQLEVAASHQTRRSA